MSEQPVTYRDAHGIHKPTENGYCAALSVVCGRWPCDVVDFINERDALQAQLAAERERSERLREALDHLVDILDTFGWSTSEHLGDNSLSDINQARALLKEASDDTHA